MAKKNRMGRNLNALLGGATRNRPTETPAESTAEQSKPTAVGSSDAHHDNNLPKAAVPISTPATAPASNPNTAQVESAVPEKPAVVVTDSPVSANTASVQEEAGSTNNAGQGSADGGARVSGVPANDESTNRTAPASASIESANGDLLPADTHPSDRLRMLGVDQITRGTYQPRRHFDQDLLQELADSITAQGLIQPILVRAYGGKFELIAGERRWRASQLAGITDIPAIVRDMDDQSVAAVSLIENIQRADLNPLEEAQALERLCAEFSMTHQQVAEAVGRSRVAVTNLMRLLELHDDVKGMVDDGELDMGHARALLGAPNSEQSGIAKRIVEQGLTVRAVEKLVKDLREGKVPSATVPAKTDPNIEALGQKLGKMLGAPVSIRHQKNGSGKMEISYSSIDELEGILSHIK